MSGKRKRGPDASLGTVANGKPLSAIAAARLKAEAAAKGITTPEVSLETVPIPSTPPPQSSRSGYEESEPEEDIVPIKRNFKLCNWRNDPSSILSETETQLSINLNKHATITLIGCFDLKVMRGAVHINGANIGTIGREGQKDRLYRIYIPATHPILKIRGLDGTNHVQFINCKEPTPLTNISPLFTDLWNAKSEDGRHRSFSIITESDADPLSRSLSPEVAPEDWLRAIEDCTGSPSITLVTGPPNSGKSIFAKRLLNRYLTGLGKTARPASAVCYLDLDPYKQEYAPSGQISLVVTRDVNLSPSFTQPTTTPNGGNPQGNETIRAHPIPVNLANYTDYYQSCIEDLFLTYKNLHSRDTSLPLIINTPGFLNTSSFDVLNKLLTRLKPHNIVHLSDTQAINTENAARIHSLQTAASHYHSTVYEVSAQWPLSIPARTEVEWKAMQMQSFFHLKASSTKFGEPQNFTWTSDPLSHLVPWEFCYQETVERIQDVVGFAMYSEPIEPALLIHALNGSIVQIVQTTSSAIPHPYTSLPRTSKHQIPHFSKSESTGTVEPLDPKTSKLICTAMVRGFDPERRVVQVLVPKTHEALLYNLSPERTVFVGGCCDPPEWAFVEDAYARERTGAYSDSLPAGEGKAEPLWVERESVMEDMGYLNTVRRVRKFQT